MVKSMDELDLHTEIIKLKIENRKLKEEIVRLKRELEPDDEEMYIVEINYLRHKNNVLYRALKLLGLRYTKLNGGGCGNITKEL